MNAVEKALWFIESHFASEITLEDLAKLEEYRVFILREHSVQRRAVRSCVTCVAAD